MSKYIKLEDAIRKYAEMIADEAYWEHGVGNGKPDEEGLDIAREYYSDLPTIEVSEDCISREDAINALLAHFIPQTYTGEQVEQASKLARKIMEGAPSVVPIYQPITIKADEKDLKPLKKQIKDIKTTGTLVTEEEYRLFGCRFRTVEHAPSEDNKAYTYCSRCGMRVVMDAPSED